MTLVLGLSFLALIAWAFSGSLGGSGPAAKDAATGTGHGGRPSHSAKPASAPAPHQTPTSSLTDAAAHGTPSGASALLPCPSGTVVLSLFSSRASYSTKQTPEFNIDVVSTANQACTFDIGTRHVVLRISAGPLPVWSSGACTDRQASLVTELRRGVPTVVPIGWEGKHATPGCPVPVSPAARGSYTAVAADGPLRSNPLQFRIIDVPGRRGRA